RMCVTITVVETPLRWRELFQHGRGQLTVGILLVEFLVAVEALVVIAIMPAVQRDLGGLEFYGLVFAGFSLAALVASPIAGRAADRRGPVRPFVLYGTLFIAGSALCGLASSMPLLALARIVQGGGAGGAYTVALAAVTRIYPASGRARVLALLAGAWIVPGLLGPSYGALMASTLGWRWAFVSIIPLIAMAMALAMPALRALPAAAQASQLSIRWALVRLGSAILTIAIIGITATLAGAPLAISYVAWFAAGVGMGIAYPTAYLVIMQGADAADPGSAVASEQVAERLALALGGGLGGVCIALAQALHSAIAVGIAGAFGIALLAALASFLLAPRVIVSPRPAVVGP